MPSRDGSATVRSASPNPPQKRAEEQLGGLLFDVEGQGGLARYLRELYGAQLSVSARKGGAPRQLRLRA